MFGWIKRRLLARKARKSLDSVRQFEAARLDQARTRPFPPAYSPSPAYSTPVHQGDPLGVNQALLMSAVLDDDRRSVSCSSSFASDSSSSWSGSDSSSSCSSSSSSSWD
ncbi:hypothetical protein OQ484_00145 [Pseudomonas aeruginosa]|uniref:hypothetical protein n=1 Tax=Pseudomonas aeruginosa TaxID=287 RepID=UPI002247F390|nr:hypothetical protein [Pseudomonas aeruginosa]MCX2515813.1 hypothetical protein [Pseudomonas aeruginosa]